LAQLFLEVNQRFTAKAFDLEQSLLPTLKTGENVPYSGHSAFAGRNCFGKRLSSVRGRQEVLASVWAFKSETFLPDLQTLVEAVHLTFAVHEASLLNL
jgi:hypothetical protein